MSAVQLGRLGRRLLPLAQQLESLAAPSAFQHFSSTATNSAAAAGEGPSSSSAQTGSVGSPRNSDGSGQGGFRRGPPRQQADGGSAGSGGTRRPGAMSQLLERDGRRGGGDRPGSGYGRPRRPGPHDAYRGARPGAPDAEDTSIDLSGVPAHLREVCNRSPSELLNDFSITLKLATGRGDEQVDFRDVYTDISDLANLERLPLLKYYMTERQWLDLSSGRMDAEEQNDLMDKLAAALLPNERDREREEGVAAAIANDPDYDLAASLGSQPQLRGSPRAPAPSHAEVAAELDAQKAHIMQSMGLNEEEFEAAKAATVRQMVALARAAATPVVPDHLKLEARLGRVLEKGLPRDHPNYAAAAQRLAVLQGNPGWSHERKMVFAKRLIKRLASPSMV